MLQRTYSVDLIGYDARSVVSERWAKSETEQVERHVQIDIGGGGVRMTEIPKCCCISSSIDVCWRLTSHGRCWEAASDLPASVMIDHTLSSATRPTATGDQLC